MNYELPTRWGTARIVTYTKPDVVTVMIGGVRTPEWTGEIDGIPFHAFLMLRRSADGWAWAGGLDPKDIEGGERLDAGGRRSRHLTTSQVQRVYDGLVDAVRQWDAAGRTTPRFDPERAARAVSAQVGFTVSSRII